MPVETAGEMSFGSMMRQMSRAMDQLQKGVFNFCPSETWTPAVNLYESDAAYLVCVDLAGVDKDRIDVLVVDNQLRLRGTRAVPMLPAELQESGESSRLRVHLMEIDHGSFCREVDLPNDVAKEQISARYLNGILWIQLPKK
jgi:HSP20 family protein